MRQRKSDGSWTDAATEVASPGEIERGGKSRGVEQIMAGQPSTKTAAEERWLRNWGGWWPSHTLCGECFEKSTARARSRAVNSGWFAPLTRHVKTIYRVGVLVYDIS